LVDETWSEGQVAAMAMAILLKGMTSSECVALTQAMTHSGSVLNWADAGLAGPVLDKHSTGGVGDKVSLLLAPIVAACGGVVPMVSGRALSHTGGTLDKLEALPGYAVAPPREQLLRVLREAGCAIFGASADLAPADRRLYAIRDVTATVESVPLITASILSKKLAAGLQALVLDVKLGNGAFMHRLDDARTLARSLVEVAGAAGLPCRALISDMDQVLGLTAGNALEVAESLDFLTGTVREPRLLALTLALSAQLLQLGGLAPTLAAGQALAEAALSSGRAAECFARMVAGLGGPADVLTDARLPAAPVQVDLVAPRDGVIASMDARALGLVVVELGGGRRRAGDTIDPRVGLSDVRPLGSLLRAGDPLLRVHAASAAQAQAACQSLLASITLADDAPPVGPVVIETLIQAP
jgi:thymidine phosphorylase